MEKLLQYVRKSVALHRTFNPIVITDIDGVLLRGHTQIPGTLDALRQLREAKVPLACLTNGGGQLEEVKTGKMNEIFEENLFSAEYMFMNHSPVRPHLRKYSQQEGILLLSGSLRITDIVEAMGISNYVTADELYTLFHQSEKDSSPNGSLQFHKRSYQAEPVV
jgi:ribonucleotide monophosphatase NagD (HAD superfamily)